MKICLISNLYHPYARGGAEKIAATVAGGLREDGHEVFIISTKPYKNFQSLKAKKEEDNVYRFYPLNVFYYLNDYRHNILWRMKWHFLDMFNLHSYFIVKSILKKEKPDIVMTHNLKGMGYLIPYLIKKSGIKHIHTLHDVQLSTPSGLIIYSKENSLEQRIFLRKWYETLCRWLFGSPDIVISPSKWLLDFYTEKGFFEKSKKAVLTNPVGLRQAQALKYSPNETLPLTKAGAESKGLRLLYIGQIEEHKGVLFLVNTLKDLDINFELHIVGVGSKLELIKNIVQGDARFIFYGFLEREKLEQVFYTADLTVVPSICYENSPAVVGESLVAGVPALVARIGGAAELIEEGKNGFTFEAGNAEDLKKALQNCFVNLDKIKKMKIFAKESSEKLKLDFYIKSLKGMIKD
ncbi:hypothetical protein A2316_03480 [Candidatus Falkowbacteria bacterium RIFOXYB2_FULL_38_15]|uniref:Glycosyltransferase subfamily 4-like N-terminal domain-containing protein n=1 Tax=Candidatus Falkowbacteria bacterium RIFOXYA2_FULL_38_12 TaxID=1797993 RepID=A0A1F5S3F6_9BACT|nr:MAG: hypothetical protein A2257_01745 [Candidatus Falkowbacteria bacterium RIFOXYA2_FULL_38_12]OGF32980.1 MAG: hypothetical protein A2316_03480 [Candidatus Falkowbacteria bacterium RIFOXYB2_FULL_38_15]OGF42622.1 MAG: hypothetical protein A2555_02460 [Candidatus Falkowbacteria bacterium RIFOXYD2_FULL_39_16]